MNWSWPNFKYFRSEEKDDKSLFETASGEGFESETSRNEGVTLDSILQDILQYGDHILQMCVFLDLSLLADLQRIWDLHKFSIIIGKA